MQCFNHTLGVLKADPRITVRLGASDDIRGEGQCTHAALLFERLQPLTLTNKRILKGAG